MIDTLTWRTEGTGYNFTRADVLSMEIGEALFYFRQAQQHCEDLAETHRRGSAGSREGVEVETETWAQAESDDSDEDEDVSVEELLDV